MNRIIKVGLAAVAIAAVSPASADEEEGSVGWTPIALGIASPVQLPWGLARWDVFGLDLNLLYSDAPKMYGLGIGGLAMTTRDDMMGLQIGGLCNFSLRNTYGLRTTAGANICLGESYGVDIGLFGFRGEFWGVDIEGLGSLQDEIHGIQIGGLANVSREMSYGWTVAGLGNFAKKAYGCQTALLFNATEELHGAQIALVNYAQECPWDFQIGLVNIIMDNKVKVLPIVNGYF